MVNAALTFSYLISLVRECGVADTWYALWHGDDARDAAADRGSLGRPVFKRPRARSGRVNMGVAGWCGQGKPRVRLCQLCDTNVHGCNEKSHGKCARSFRNCREGNADSGSPHWKIYVFLRSAEPPQPRQNIFNILFYLYFLQAIQYKHCSAIYVVCSYLRTYVISPTFIFIFYLFITIDMNVTWE